MARADTVTLMGLDRYAALMGLALLQFNQATIQLPSGLTVFPIQSRCNDLWFQHPWQSPDYVSRDELATELQSAEEDLISVLQWSPAPHWVTKVVPFPRTHWDARLRQISLAAQPVDIKLGERFLIAGGQRAATLLESGVAVVFSDADGDGFAERATISVATTITETTELQVFFTGHNGAKEWQIRDPISVTANGTTATFIFNSWQLLNPDLWDVFPTSEQVDTSVILDGTQASLVSVVDVYRVYNNTTTTSCEFIWPSTKGGVDSLGLTTQTGIVEVLDSVRGYIRIFPATYNATTASWSRSSWSKTYLPQSVRLWYYAGKQDSSRYDQLSNYWAYTIMLLTTARLNKTLSSCDPIRNRAERLQTDLLTTPRIVVPFDVYANPFGMRIGEIMTYRRVVKTNVQRHAGEII